MARVDPFVIQWPQKWMADNEIRPVIEYLNRFLHDMFIRTGGGDDAIDDPAPEASIAIISQLVKQLANLELQNVDTSSAMLSGVLKRLDDLEVTQTVSDAAGVNTAIKSTFDRRYALLVG